MIIKNGTVYDAVHREPYAADVRVENGKIAEIGADLPVNDNEEVFDAAGLRVYPGFIDAHCHLGLDGWGIGFEGADYNEGGDPCTPHLRAEDSFNPQDPTVRHAALGGVTSVATAVSASAAHSDFLSV